jgi:hypothetical protein
MVRLGIYARSMSSETPGVARQTLQDHEDVATLSLFYVCFARGNVATSQDHAPGRLRSTPTSGRFGAPGL